MSTGREWPSEQCPPWCVADHTRHLMPQDFLHESVAAEVPVVLLHWYRGLDGQIRRKPSGAVARCRALPVPMGIRAMVYIGGEDAPDLEMSIESARRLVKSCRRLSGDEALVAFNQDRSTYSSFMSDVLFLHWTSITF